MAHRSEEDLLAERDLIIAAQQNPAEFGLLYERYVDQIFAYAYTLTRNRELAEDVTAATFARAIEQLPKFEWRGVPYSAWLYRVASNLVARERRRPGWVELNVHAADSGLTPSDLAELSDRDDRIRVAVASLPRDQRQAIVLRFGGELRNREIAGIMGRTEGAVKLLTFRALTALRKGMGAPLPADRPAHRVREESDR